MLRSSSSMLGKSVEIQLKIAPTAVSSHSSSDSKFRTLCLCVDSSIFLSIISFLVFTIDLVFTVLLNLKLIYFVFFFLQTDNPKHSPLARFVQMWLMDFGIAPADASSSIFHSFIFASQEDGAIGTIAVWAKCGELALYTNLHTHIMMDRQHT